MKLYLAGPMSDIPLYNFAAFDNGAADLRLQGHDVVSPAELTRYVWREWYKRDFDPATDKVEWGDPILAEMLKRDLEAVCDAEAIALLPGWERSKGANIELTVARQLGKGVYLYRPVTGALDPLLAGYEPETTLQEAQRLVHGERQVAYGHPHDDYERTGKLWGAILGRPPIPPHIACLMMGAVKISRQVNSPKRDNMVDLAGYAECAQMCVEREQIP